MIIRWLIVAALGIIWGSFFMFIELGPEHFMPFKLTEAQIVFASVFTAALWHLRIRRLHLDKTRSWGGLRRMGMLSASIPLQLVSWAPQYEISCSQA